MVYLRVEINLGCNYDGTLMIFSVLAFTFGRKSAFYFRSKISHQHILLFRIALALSCSAECMPRKPRTRPLRVSLESKARGISKTREVVVIIPNLRLQVGSGSQLNTSCCFSSSTHIDHEHHQPVLQNLMIRPFYVHDCSSSLHFPSQTSQRLRHTRDSLILPQ